MKLTQREIELLSRYPRKNVIRQFAAQGLADS